MVKRSVTPRQQSLAQMNGVVVEGITCSGKTELVSSLKSELKRFGGFDVKELAHVDCGDQYARYLKEYATQERILLHRSHISEYVLGRLLRAHSPFSKNELTTLNKILALRFVCVLVEPPNFKFFLERMAQDKRHVREPYNKDRYTQIIASFRRSFDHIPHLHYISSSFADLQSTKDAIIAKLTLELPRAEVCEKADVSPL